MGVRLIGLTTLVAAGLVLGIVLASGGEPGEGPSKPTVAATAASPEAADEPPVAADAAESPPPEPTTLRYNRLDITGAATAPGSYAFLKTAGDATSAIENFGYSADEGVELRIHPTDASGTSRAAFYDIVQVGDIFDYRTDGFDCGFRFRVTSVAAIASPRTFGLERVTNFGTRCLFVDDPGTAKDVHFVWRVTPGSPDPEGVRLMLYGEPAGPGTYRLFPGLPYVIDVPAGMQVIHHGYSSGERAPGAPPDAPVGAVLLIDAATGSKLGIDPATGRETRRIVTSPEVDALFDQIIASARPAE